MDQHTKDVLDLYQKGTNEKIDSLRDEVRTGFAQAHKLHYEQQKDIKDLKKFKFKITYFTAGIVAVFAFLADWIKLGVNKVTNLF
jgi:hypothetical protein